MKINPYIISCLKKYNITVEDGLSYLLSVYFDCRPSYTPPLLVQKINVTNILGISQERELVWNIPLFEPFEENKNWGWVKDWNDQFGIINKARKASLKTVETRMKAFFAENPDVRKEEVLGATKLYFSTLSSAEYLITSSYFIFKDKGKDRTSSLEGWVEKYREIVEKEVSGRETDITSQMQ